MQNRDELDFRIPWFGNTSLFIYSAGFPSFLSEQRKGISFYPSCPCFPSLVLPLPVTSTEATRAYLPRKAFGVETAKLRRTRAKKTGPNSQGTNPTTTSYEALILFKAGPWPLAFFSPGEYSISTCNTSRPANIIYLDSLPTPSFASSCCFVTCSTFFNHPSCRLVLQLYHPPPPQRHSPLRALTKFGHILSIKQAPLLVQPHHWSGSSPPLPPGNL